MGDLFSISIGSPVTRLVHHKDGLIAASDATNKVVIAHCDTSEKLGQRLKAIVTVSKNFGATIQQIIFSGDGHKLLVAAPTKIQVFKLDKDNDSLALKQHVDLQPVDGDNWRFFSCSTEENGFQIIEQELSHFLQQEPQAARLKGRRLNGDNQQTQRIKTIAVHSNTGYLIVEYGSEKGTTQLIVLEPRSLSEPDPMDPIPQVSPVVSSENYRLLLHLSSHHVKKFLGISNDRLVYLANHLWVKSVDLWSLKSYVSGQDVPKDRHFFIPREYIGGNYHAQAVVGSNGEIVFPRRGELTVIWGGLG